MVSDEVILSLLGPIGPMVDFEDYEAYRAQTIARLDRADVMRLLDEWRTKYAPFPDDVEVLAIEFAEHHPEYQAEVSAALLKAGFDPLEQTD